MFRESINTKLASIHITTDVDTLPFHTTLVLIYDK